MAGAAKMAIRSHGSAAPAMAESPATALVSGPAMTCTTATISTPKPKASQVACTPSRTAAARSPAPWNRADRAVVP